MVRGIVLSERILSKLVGLCKRLEELTIFIDEQSNEASRKSLVELASRIIANMRPIARLRRTSLLKLATYGFSYN